MPDPHLNFCYGTVLTAPSPATSGTSLVLNSGQGALFPAPASVGAFNIVIWPAGTQPLSTNAEIARCTARSTDTLTITRAQESTSARTVVVGDQVMMAPTSKVFTDIEAMVARQKIAQTILGSPVASVDWQSIPATFANLVVVLSARASDATTDIDVGLRFNNDSTAVYDRGLIYEEGYPGSGDKAFQNEATGDTSANVCSIPANTATANFAGHAEILIPGYAGTTFHKSVMSKASGGPLTQLVVVNARWRSTAAINRITLTNTNGGNFNTGSTFTLYGDL